VHARPPNGLPLSRERRESQLAISRNPHAPLVGLQRLVMRPSMLEILWTQPSFLGDFREHFRADLLAVVKGEHEVRPACPFQELM